ncbi:unnamed protein product [Calypogeia fissa]
MRDRKFNGWHGGDKGC